MGALLARAAHRGRHSAMQVCVVFSLVALLVAAAPLLAPSVVAAASIPGEVLLGFEEPYVREGRSVDHSGLDIRVDAGDAVACLTRGEVVFAGPIPAGPGQSTNAVTVRDQDGGRWSYLPLESVIVAQGTTVPEGAALGVLAATGDASSDVAHLHVGYRRDGEYVNPLAELDLAETQRTVVRDEPEVSTEGLVDECVAAGPATFAGAQGVSAPAQIAVAEPVSVQAAARPSTSQPENCAIRPAMQTRDVQVHRLEVLERAGSYARLAPAAVIEPAQRARTIGPFELMLLSLAGSGGVTGMIAYRTRMNALNEVCAGTRSSRLQPR